jgi:hypothetical protein
VPFIYPNEAPLSDTHYPNGPNIKKPWRLLYMDAPIENEMISMTRILGLHGYSLLSTVCNNAYIQL